MLSVTQEFSHRLEPANIVTYHLDAGGERNGQDEARYAPQRAPEHERDRDGQQIRCTRGPTEIFG